MKMANLDDEVLRPILASFESLMLDGFTQNLCCVPASHILQHPFAWRELLIIIDHCEKLLRQMLFTCKAASLRVDVWIVVAVIETLAQKTRYPRKHTFDNSAVYSFSSR